MTSWRSRYAPLVAAYGLRGATGGLPAAPLDGAAWDELLGDVVSQRITGHLARALADSALAATDAQRAQAGAAHERALATDLLLERQLLLAAHRLEGAGLDFRVLKGALLAHLAYPDPNLRSFGDVDLLVRSEEYEQATDVLCSFGAERKFQEPRPSFNRRFGKGVCLTTHDGYELDVHRTLVAGPFGLALDLDDLFAAPLQVTIGGTTLRGLGRDARLLNACFHVSLGASEPRLVAMRDVAQLVLHDEADAVRLHDIARRWRCRIVVQRAVALTWQHLSLGEGSEAVEWAWRYRPDAFEQRSLAAYVGPRRSYASQASAGLAAVKGVSAKFAYAAALLFPDAEYLDERDGSYWRRWRRAAGLLRDSWTRRAAGDEDQV